MADRLGSVLHVLHLVFNEGYTATADSDLHRTVRDLLPADGEVIGLLALIS